VRSEGGRREVVEEVASYYYSERLHLLRCLKHMLGFWQDPNHPFRVCPDPIPYQFLYSLISLRMSIVCVSEKLRKMRSHSSNQ
jgi:hypothetical protein